MHIGKALGSYAVDFNDSKLRTHHGAVDQDALTSRPPHEVFVQVKQALGSMGIDVKRDGEYKLKCTRRKRKAAPDIIVTGSQVSGVSETTETVYGDPVVDSGEEVRFSVELCKIKNLPGLYIVDIRRMKGSVWAYKCIYHALLETLDLS
ncbi:hypothetical protein PHYBLDRAFT_126049, partial [Phycomyces blakesleeanus NRRL 1555(-)]